MFPWHYISITNFDLYFGGMALIIAYIYAGQGGRNKATGHRGRHKGVKGRLLCYNFRGFRNLISKLYK